VELNAEQAKHAKEIRRMTNECIKEVTDELKVTHQFNTAIARLMKLSNVLSSTAIKATKDTPLPSDVTLPVTAWDPATIDVATVDSAEWRHALETLIKLLSPMAPHFTAEAWRLLCADATARDLPAVDVMTEPWPSFDVAALAKETVPLVIQINGKSRGSIDVPVGLSETELQNQARDSVIGQRWLKDKKIVKVIAVPNRGLVNFVVQ
jgi:leucyl-tRNA synthetase